MIPTRIHGILDYVVGILLIAAPWIFGFYHHGAESWVPICLGSLAIVYSLLTRYELGVLYLFSVPLHLTLDFLSGLLLLASPWLFHFSHIIVWPHVVVGLLEMGLAVLTQHRAHFALDSDNPAPRGSLKLDRKNVGTPQVLFSARRPAAHFTERRPCHL